MATVTRSLSPQEQYDLAKKLERITKHVMQVKPTNAATEADPSQEGNLLVAYLHPRSEWDLAFIDTRKGTPEADLAKEMRRIARIYLRAARRLEGGVR